MTTSATTALKTLHATITDAAQRAHSTFADGDFKAGYILGLRDALSEIRATVANSEPTPPRVVEPVAPARKVRIRAYVASRTMVAQAPMFMEGPDRDTVESALMGFRDKMARHMTGYYAIRATVVTGPAKIAKTVENFIPELAAALPNVRDARIMSVFDQGMETRLEQPTYPPLAPFPATTRPRQVANLCACA